MVNLFYFDGNPSDPNVVNVIKDTLLNLLERDLFLCDYPGENPPGQCKKDKFKVTAGELSGKEFYHRIFNVFVNYRSVWGNYH